MGSEPKFCLALVWVDRNLTRMHWFVDNEDRVIITIADEEKSNRQQLKEMAAKLQELLNEPEEYWDPVAIRAELEGEDG